MLPNTRIDGSSGKLIIFAFVIRMLNSLDFMSNGGGGRFH